ncbi:MAG: hypothetical protein PUH77_09940 [Bacteroidales bacterium]|nr:hypothetical protein [Bacteroidales bacterium]MDY2860477.1 hypothetical protein [Candidatus Cryptobacteroides sp.]MDD7083608.1 hypothetical protein [Bacteroidales bacterium]MDD7119177.1 hypothetical protein [Bacteroidales bacterium]MDY5262543.1 hypothetical protein [Candidatus Cryptobacteroides sp.]
MLQDSIIGKDPLDKGKDLDRYFILGRDHHEGVGPSLRDTSPAGAI